MATYQKPHSVTIPAGANLSAEQFTFVVINSSGQVVQQTTAGGDAVGILGNKPAAAGDPAEVVIGGIMKCVLGATVAAGAKVQSDTTGRAITAATGDHVLGVCLVGGAVDTIGEIVLVNHHILA